MIALIKPTQIRIFLNPDGKSMSEVKNETGCQYIINGGLFESLTKPCPLLKVNGLWRTGIPYSAWGMTWNSASDCEMSNKAKANFISCVDLINPWDGGVSRLSYPSDMGGSRQRTAWGILSDGRHLLYCDKQGRTPEGLREYLTSNYDFASLLMLDGGGSTQGDFNGNKVTASRKVANFICFWTDDTTDTDHFRESTKLITEDSMATLKQGSSGTAVKTLQTDLNTTLNASLTTDGEYGTNTLNAVKRFQAAYGITCDGIAGNATQAALTAVKAIMAKTETEADKLIAKAFEYFGKSEPNGDDMFIKAYNDCTGAGFGLTVSWCEIFVWYCLKYFNLDCPETASCTAARKYWQEQGKWRDSSYTPKKGDLIYYDFDSSGDCDHVGFVVSVDEQYIQTIEGNTSTAIGDSVALKQHDKGSTYITGYADALADTKTAKKSKDYIVKFTKEDAETLAKAYNGEVVKA